MKDVIELLPFGTLADQLLALGMQIAKKERVATFLFCCINSCQSGANGLLADGLSSGQRGFT